MATQIATPASPQSSSPEADLERKDQWWWAPLGFVVLFTTFALWATFRAFQNSFYESYKTLHVSQYLSPFYSPIIPLGLHFGRLAISPALLIMPFPLSFRLSCYYYRKAIYRGYIADPFACAVKEPKPLAKARFRRYTGERVFPLIAQNFHRYAFYAAVVFIVILWIDTIRAFFFNEAGTGWHFGIHVGSLVFLANILLLSTYTFSCHSWRHLIGGSVDCYSCSALTRTRHGLWTKISFLNERHGLWAMLSLCSVGLLDLYVYLASSGAIRDFRIF